MKSLHHFEISNSLFHFVSSWVNTWPWPLSIWSTEAGYCRSSVQHSGKVANYIQFYRGLPTRWLFQPITVYIDIFICIGLKLRLQKIEDLLDTNISDPSSADPTDEMEHMNELFPRILNLEPEKPDYVDTMWWRYHRFQRTPAKEK